jgi:hypothetical protein
VIAIPLALIAVPILIGVGLPIFLAGLVLLPLLLLGGFVLWLLGAAAGCC